MPKKTSVASIESATNASQKQPTKQINERLTTSHASVEPIDQRDKSDGVSQNPLTTTTAAAVDDQDIFVNILDEEEIVTTRSAADGNHMDQRTLQTINTRKMLTSNPTKQSMMPQAASINPKSSDEQPVRVRKRGRPPKISTGFQQDVFRHEFIPTEGFPHEIFDQTTGKVARTAFSFVDDSEGYMFEGNDEEDPPEFGEKFTEYYADLGELPKRATVCCLCPDQPMFVDRNAYYAHRYEAHGAVATVFACPDLDCDLVFASAATVKRHLAVDHEFPIESHFRKFNSVFEFNEWILELQYTTDTRFVMYNRQKPKRRQLLYCACSDHRAMSIKRQGMAKPKGCCPVHANYLVHEDGAVDVIYQMFHYGHHPNSLQLIHTLKPWTLGERVQKGVKNEFSSCRASFPVKPIVLGTRPMQFIQVDILEMPDAIYRMGSRYSHILVVTCLYSKFMFARSLLDEEERHQEHIVYRLLTEILSTFGVPEGYSCSFGKKLVDRCMDQLEELFRVNVFCISNENPCYVALRQNIELRAEMELQDRMRWPEALPFTILSHNQSPHAAFQYRVSPFEMMFHRRAWYKTDPDAELPWTDNAEISSEQRPGSSMSATRSCNFIRQHDPNFTLPDAKGNAIEGPLKSNLLRTISNVETECQRYEDPIRERVREKLGLKLTFSRGEHVYVRYPLAKEGYLRGLLAEADWECSPNFPYRVHIDLTEEDKEKKPYVMQEKWPNEDSPSIWVSAYDLGSTTVVTGPDGLLNTENLYCQCSSECALFGNSFCSNGMSRVCCLKSGHQCAFHDFYDPRIMPIDRYVESYAENPERVRRRVVVGREDLARQERLDEEFKMEQERLAATSGAEGSDVGGNGEELTPPTIESADVGQPVENQGLGAASTSIATHELANNQKLFRQTRYLVLDDREILPVVSIVTGDEMSLSQQDDQGGANSIMDVEQHQEAPPPKKIARGILSRRGPSKSPKYISYKGPPGSLPQ